jgi:predicted acylesterase/phospholipase RssA
VALAAEFRRAYDREVKSLGGAARFPTAHYLAISGGGDNGAFGAGLLAGWTESGTRPNFKAVTGISTGALIAPFAFLGAEYDQQLAEVYTTINQRDVFEKRPVLAAIASDGMADTSPLYRLISKYLDDQMIERIGREYDRGRLLLIGTTNLDAGRAVVWNIGAIAKSPNPKAPELIRRILLASASIPAAFPPVMFEVSLDGAAYQELQADGGAMAQTFLYPPN